ncbi:ANR family transcriptional regulator [Vibrio parahaemolyticus]|nr:ANR family transcriptional regulator [Vibrio parahaemolyticus]
MRIKKYLDLAKNARRAEKKKRVARRYNLWRSAQKAVPSHHIDNEWAEKRALFCQHRMPAPESPRTWSVPSFLLR